MAKRAILYSRVSTPEQAKLYSLSYQFQQERTYAEEMGFEIVAELSDDSSGRSMNRDGLTLAREMLARNEADVLVVWKLDRLHRSYVNTVLLKEELKKLGKELFYAQSKTKSGTTARESLPENILSLLAEIEAEEIKERTTIGKRQKALSGKWIGFHKPPYGYTSVGRARNKEVVIDEDQARIVVLIFNWYVYGDGKTPPLSTIEIAEKLTALGIPSPADKAWGRTTIYRILHEPAYAGTFYHYKRKQRDGKSLTNFNKDEHVAVPFPQIIDEETFQLAQDKLTDGRNLTNTGNKYRYLLGKRVWCECGYKMLTNSLGRTYTKKDGTESHYEYHQYRCRGGRRDAVRKCTQKNVLFSTLDDRVWEYVREEIANPSVLERKLREIQTKQLEEKTPAVDRLVTLEKHRDTIADELRRLAVLYAKRSMPEHLLTDLIDQQNQKLRLTEEEIERIENETEEPISDEAIADLVLFAEDFQARLETVEESFESKRAVIDGLDVRVVVKTREKEQYLEISTLLSPDSVLWPLIHDSTNVYPSAKKIRITERIRLCVL